MRRTLAQQFCDKGLVKVNDVKAKSSREVKAGDVLEIRRGKLLMKAKILHVPNTKQVSKEMAGNLYEVVSEEVLEDSFFASAANIE